jgi:hypothetical protein
MIGGQSVPVPPGNPAHPVRGQTEINVVGEVRERELRH